MIYEVVLTDSFLKDLKKLMYDLKDYYRIRIGKLRVLYTIQNGKVYVEAVVRGHKYEEVYETVIIFAETHS